MAGRKAAIVLALALGLVAGCGDDSGDTSSTTSTTLPPLQCPDPITVTSTDDLVEVLAALHWGWLGGYTSGQPSITPDLVVTGTVILEAADLPIPQECLDRSDCSPAGHAGYVYLDGFGSAIVGPPGPTGPVDVPTLSEWALILLSLGLGGVAMWSMRGRSPLKLG